MVDQLTRRNFIISLGVGAAVISGYFCVSEKNVRSNALSAEEETFLPCLRSDVIFERQENLVAIGLKAKPQSPLCGVNDIGFDIIKSLDGKHTIDDIAEELSESRGIARDNAFDAKIALFITKVGAAGLLGKPFFVNIVDSYYET